MTLANMTQEETNRHNREHCKRIANELERVANGTAYTCPDCRNTYNEDDLADNWNGDAYTCPDCENVELEQASMYDWLEDALDWDIVINRNGEYKACRVLVTFGGPNIYVDTLHERVELFWWADRASYDISKDAVAELDECLEELYQCGR